jgi:hypothetical protein
MERKRGVKVPYNLTLSCMRKYFTNLNLSSALFGQCSWDCGAEQKCFRFLNSKWRKKSFFNVRFSRVHTVKVKGLVQDSCAIWLMKCGIHFTLYLYCFNWSIFIFLWVRWHLSENGTRCDEYASREAIQGKCVAYSTFHELMTLESRTIFIVHTQKQIFGRTYYRQICCGGWMSSTAPRLNRGRNPTNRVHTIELYSYSRDWLQR